ncbi:large conductance mechanosensitive channel protein MscL [Altererythrobacter sp.]|nr:large conductance mechanosensitive channel protein MscL [Altererythrobacter sp.]
MNFFAEFRKFIARGNVLDLAIGVVIGAAFGKIVTSLTESVIMPFIGWIFGDVDFSNYFLQLGAIPDGYSGSLTNYAELKEAGVAMIGYGDFLTQLVNFVIIAGALFMLLKTVNRVVDEMQDLQGQSEDSSQQDDIPTDPQLDVLKKILAEMRSGNKVSV